MLRNMDRSRAYFNAKPLWVTTGVYNLVVSPGRGSPVCAEARFPSTMVLSAYPSTMRIRYLAMLFIMAVPTVWLLVMMALATIRGRNSNICESCGMRKVRPSWPGAMLDRALAHFGIVPYKCEGCLRRFYGWRWRYRH
jgi:hypothetical protein